MILANENVSQTCCNFWCGRTQGRQYCSKNYIWLIAFPWIINNYSFVKFSKMTLIKTIWYQSIFDINQPTFYSPYLSYIWNVNEINLIVSVLIILTNNGFPAVEKMLTTELHIYLSSEKYSMRDLVFAIRWEQLLAFKFFFRIRLTYFFFSCSSQFLSTF